MHSRTAVKPLRAMFAASLGAFAAAVVGSGPGDAKPAKSRADIIVSGLPGRGSPEYEALAKRAGRMDVEALDMTNAEMWSVRADKLDAFTLEAASRGVKIVRLGADANHMLAPMAPGTAMSGDQKAMMDRTMGSKAVMGVEMMALPEASVMEYALTKGMHAKSAGPPPTLAIALTTKITVNARRTSVTKTEDGYAWHGEIEATGEPVTLLWWPDGRLSGSITYRDRLYTVKQAGGGMHAVTEVAPAMLPPEHAPADPGMMRKMNMTDDPLVRQGDASVVRPSAERHAAACPSRAETKNLEDAPIASRSVKQPAPVIDQSAPTSFDARGKTVVISLVVAFTKQAASYYGDIATDLIALAIEDANQSFRNSGIGNVRLELARAYETNYVESGGHFDHVWRFADKGDGFLDEIHALRDEHRADVAVLVVHDPVGCGLSTKVAADADEAFAVVHHECAATMYSLAHEIGHIIGARHDRALDQSPGPFPYGHGFVNGTKWRTMMAYKDTCDGCPRVPVWSSPTVKVKGARAGTAAANNAKVIEEQASRVAAFR